MSTLSSPKVQQYQESKTPTHLGGTTSTGTTGRKGTILSGSGGSGGGLATILSGSKKNLLGL